MAEGGGRKGVKGRKGPGYRGGMGEEGGSHQLFSSTWAREEWWSEGAQGGRAGERSGPLPSVNHEISLLFSHRLANLLPEGPVSEIITAASSPASPSPSPSPPSPRRQPPAAPPPSARPRRRPSLYICRERKGRKKVTHVLS